MSVRNFTVSVVLCILLIAALIWPAIYNGQPFFFSDTTTYIRGADAGFQRVTGIVTPWNQQQSEAATPSVSSIQDKTVLAGRSIYYGALLYVGDRIDHLWFTVATQGLLVIVAIILTLRALNVFSRFRLVALTLTLTATTTIAFYVSFLMPDAFTGVAILACACLITTSRPLRKLDYYLWAVLLTMSLTYHSSHLLIAAAMLGISFLWNLLRRSWTNFYGLGAIIVAMMTAVAADAAFSLGVKHFIGAPPLEPPFLMARLIENGPGYRYLESTCPKSGFVVCNFLDRLPLQAGDFLWSFPPKKGVFAQSTPEVRRALSEEQYRFVAAVMAYDPWGVTETAVTNVLEQLTLTGLGDFNYEHSQELLYKIPKEYHASFLASAAYNDRMPTRFLSIVALVTYVAGVAYIFCTLSIKPFRLGSSRRQMEIAALVLFGVVANAAICGALSGPHDRYQARVEWLTPLITLALISSKIVSGRPNPQLSNGVA